SSEVTDRNSGKAVTSGLVSMWTFDEGSGTSCSDDVNDNDGTVSGASWVVISEGSVQTDIYEYYSPSGLLKRKIEAATGDVYEYEDDNSYYNNNSYGRPLIASSHTTTVLGGTYTSSSWYKEYTWDTQDVEIAEYDGEYSVSAGYSTKADVQSDEMRVKYVYMHNSHYTVNTASSNWDMVAKAIYDTNGEGDSNFLEAYQWYSGNGYTPGEGDLMKSYNKSEGTGTEWDNTQDHKVITSAVYTASSPLVGGVYTPNDYYLTYDWSDDDVIEKGYSGTYTVSSTYTTRTDVVASELRVEKTYKHTGDYTLHNSTWYLEDQLIYKSDGTTKDDYFEYYSDGSGSTPGETRRAIDYGNDLSEWSRPFDDVISLDNSVRNTRSYMNCGSDSSLDITGALTLEAWVRTTADTTGTRAFIFNKFDQDNTKDGYALALVNNKLLFYCQSGSTGAWVGSSSNSAINDGFWHHIAVTYSSGSGTYYIDGQADGTFGTSTDPGSTSGLDLHIGGTSRGGKNIGFNGDIEHAGIYSTSLKSSDIALLSIERDISTNAVSEWDFTEGSGTTVSDSAGSNTGTLVNTISWNDSKHRKVLYASYPSNGTKTLYGSYTTDNSYNAYDWNYRQGVYTTGHMKVAMYDGSYTASGGDALYNGIVDSELRVEYVYAHNGEYTNLDPSSNTWTQKAQTIYDPADGTTVDELYEWYTSGRMKRSYDSSTGNGTEWEDTANHYTIGTATYTTTVIVSGLYTADNSYSTYDWTYSNGIYTTGYVGIDVYDGEYSVDVGDAIAADVVASEKRVTNVYKHNGDYTDLDASSNNWTHMVSEVYSTDADTIIELSEWYSDSSLRRYYEEDSGYGTEWEPTSQGHKVVLSAKYTTEVLVSGLYTASNSYKTYDWNPTQGGYTTGYVEVEVFDGMYIADSGEANWVDVQDSEYRVGYIYKHNGSYTNLDPSSNGWNMVAKEIVDTDGDTTLEAYEWYISGNGLKRSYDASTYNATEWQDSASHYVVGTASYTTTVLESGVYTASNSYKTFDWTYDTGQVLMTLYDGEYSVDFGDDLGADVQAAEKRLEYVYKHNSVYTNLDTSSNGWRMLHKGLYSTDGSTLIEGNWFYDNSDNRLYQKLEGEGSSDDAYQYFDAGQGIGGDDTYYAEIRWAGDYTIYGFRGDYTNHPNGSGGVDWMQYDASYSTLAEYNIDSMKTFEYYSGSYSNVHEWINEYTWNTNTWTLVQSHQHDTSGNYSTTTYGRTTNDSFKPSDIPDKPAVTGSGGSSLYGADMIDNIVSEDALIPEEMKSFFEKIDRLEKTYSGEGVLVALLDSGLDSGRLEVDIGGGYDFAGKSRSDGLGDDDYTDSTGHGTSTAEVFNETAPDAEVLVAKVLDDYGMTSSSIVADAIKFAVDAGARVLAMPFELMPVSVMLDKTIDYALEKGAILIASAGNSGSEIEDKSLASKEGVLTVGSIEKDGALSAWSNYGDELDLLAPWDVVENEEGTSYSAAFVAGVAALMLEEDPDLTSNELIAKLKELMPEVRKDKEEHKIKGDDAEEVLSMLDAERENREGFTGYTIQEEGAVDILDQ
ncbi:MAG: S8 family serine peptidase, partial [Candidatus Omnitrophica bacterium]|nr:S8 family serine peptidase [Candidatus Omnitrophota bacterium]